MCFLISSTVKAKYLFFVICFHSLSSYGVSQEDYRNLRQSTAVVYNDEGQGSGFFIAENLLVTNYHVIQSSMHSWVSRHAVEDSAVEGLVFDNVTVKLATLQGKDIGRVLITDSENDLAIIQTSKEGYKPLVLGRDSEISRGRKIFTIGYPAIGHKPTDPKVMRSVLAEGSVGTQMGSELFHMTSFTSKGNSGAPVFSKDLRVIGIAVGGLSEELKSPYAFALPISKLKNLIESYRGSLERRWGIHFHQTYPTVSERPDKYIRSAEDMFRLGLAYQYGLGGIEQSYGEALLWYERAGHRGHINAQFYAGKVSHQMNKKTHSEYKKSISQEEYERTFYWSERAAKQGHVEAMSFTGYLYYINPGKVGGPDYERAFYWLEKAAKQGDVEARFNYAQMLTEGIVGPPDLKKAREEFKALADQGNDRAHFRLLMIDGKAEGKSPLEVLEEWREQKKTPCPYGPSV